MNLAVFGLLVGHSRTPSAKQRLAAHLNPISSSLSQANPSRTIRRLDTCQLPGVVIICLQSGAALSSKATARFKLIAQLRPTFIGFYATSGMINRHRQKQNRL